MFNTADIIILAVILFLGYISFKRGLIKTVTGLLANIISIIVSRLIYPFITLILRSTPLYESIKETVADIVSVNTMAVTNKAQADFINSLGLPEIIKTSLMENNNSTVYDILGVNAFNDYISGYISNIVLSIISMIIVFITANIIIAVICTILLSAKNIPVIGFFDSLGGGLLGVVQAVLIIWIGFTVITLFFAQPSLIESITNSMIASKLYETDIILDMVLKISA